MRAADRLVDRFGVHRLSVALSATHVDACDPPVGLTCRASAAARFAPFPPGLVGSARTRFRPVSVDRLDKVGSIRKIG